jgi:hypothetical protein
MRTTLNIDDEILEIAKSAAAVHQISVGEVISNWAKRGLNAPIGTRRDPVSGLLVFDTPEDGPTITSEDVQRALDNADVEEYAKYFRKP